MEGFSFRKIFDINKYLFISFLAKMQFKILLGAFKFWIVLAECDGKEQKSFLALNAKPQQSKYLVVHILSVFGIESSYIYVQSFTLIFEEFMEIIYRK